MKVVIAIDDSSFSKAVIEEAAVRQWAPGTELMVVSVVALPSDAYWQDWGLPVMPAVKRALTAETENLIIRNVEFLKEHLQADAFVEGRLLSGHIIDAIVATAQEVGADLIMVGSHGRGAFEKMLLGSVAEGVLMRSPCSVEIVKCAARAKRAQPANLAS